MMYLIFYKVNYPKINNNHLLYKYFNKNLFDKANIARNQEIALKQLRTLLYQDKKLISKQKQQILYKKQTHKRVKSDFVQKKLSNKNLGQFIHGLKNQSKDLNCLTLQPKISTQRDRYESLNFNDIDQTRLGGSFITPIHKNKDFQNDTQVNKFGSFQNLSQSLLQYSRNLKLLKNLTGHLDSIRTINFLNHNSLITTGEDSIIKVHSIRNSFKQIIRTKGIPLCSTKTNSQFFTANHKGLLNCYQIQNNKLQYLSQVQTIEQEPIWSLCIQNNLVCSTSPDFIKFWQFSQKNLKLIQNWKAKEKNFIQSEFQNETLWNSFCYKANKSKSFLQQLDLETQQLIQVIQSDNNYINSFKLLPEKSLIISGNDDHTINLFDIKSGKIVKHFKAHENEVSCLDVNLEYGLIASGGDDGSVRLWDLRSLRCGGESSLHCQKFNNSIFDVKFHTSIKVLATAGADHTSKVFCFD